MKTVLLFGTFDIIHAGHRDLFRQAHALGDTLHIILARDATVEQVKGHPTHFTELERKAHLEAEPLVDTVHLGSLTDRYAAIRDIAPDVIVLGYDQEVFVDKLQEKLAEWGLPTLVQRATPFHPDTYKSSLLRNRIDNAIL